MTHFHIAHPGASSSPEVSAAENQSREVEGRTCPSSATAKAPEVISKGGLTTDEARRLEKSGPNAMPDTSAHPIRMALDKFWAPVPWMLEAAIVVELALGKYFEAGIIALLLVFNAALRRAAGHLYPRVGARRASSRKAGRPPDSPLRRR